MVRSREHRSRRTLRTHRSRPPHGVRVDSLPLVPSQRSRLCVEREQTDSGLVACCFFTFSSLDVCTINTPPLPCLVLPCAALEVLYSGPTFRSSVALVCSLAHSHARLIALLACASCCFYPSSRALHTSHSLARLLAQPTRFSLFLK